MNVLESVSLGSNGRLLVVEFGREKLLVGVSRAGITLLTATEQNLPHA